jgi:hypothetical protein
MKLRIDPMVVLNVMNTQAEQDRNVTLFAQLYAAANRYRMASDEVRRRVRSINEAMAGIEQRGDTHSDFAGDAVKLTVALAERKNAEDKFRGLCEVRGIEVEEPETVAG